MPENAAWSTRAGVRDGRLLRWILIAGALVLAAGCGSSQRSAAPIPASCHQWACVARQTVDLPDHHTVTLWLGGNPQDYQSRPVIELLDRGVAVQWWISPQGDGWTGSLTCNTSGPEPNCDLLDSVGMHAGVAEMVILRGGRLVHPADAQVTTNSVGMSAADLNGDGYLDVIGSTNDYRPNYAQGHTYWQTFRYDNGRLVVTGCAPQARGSAAPSHLLTGPCPSV